MAFFWVFETGIILLRFTMLEQGLDKVVREIRVNNSYFAPDSSDQERFEQVKADICSSSSTLKDCTSNLLVELIEVADTADFQLLSAKCVDRVAGLNPVVSFDLGSGTGSNSSSIMYIRACFLVDPILPSAFGLKLSTEASGAVALVTDSAFVNEPS